MNHDTARSRVVVDHNASLSVVLGRVPCSSSMAPHTFGMPCRRQIGGALKRHSAITGRRARSSLSFFVSSQHARASSRELVQWT